VITVGLPPSREMTCRPLAVVYAILFPSGDQSIPHHWSLCDGTRIRELPPAAGITRNVLSCPKKAINSPSGDQARFDCSTLSASIDTCRCSPPPRGTIKILLGEEESDPSPRMNAICEPSGDHSGAYPPIATRVAVPPSTGTVKRPLSGLPDR
jgi:hypothetical protein